jgi:hypothetical protein
MPDGGLLAGGRWEEETSLVGQCPDQCQSSETSKAAAEKWPDNCMLRYLPRPARPRYCQRLGEGTTSRR